MQSKVFCGTDGQFCSVGCQARGEHRDWALTDPWVAVARCPICHDRGGHSLSCPTRWYPAAKV